jgi:hypothetical protein
VSGREDLAARQAALVAALVAGAPPPDGLDAERVRIQSVALLRKRGRSVAHAEPELAQALGREFGPAFAAYATGRPQAGCTADDAGEFARFLLKSEHARDAEVRRVVRHITLRRLLRRATRPSGFRDRAADPAQSPVPLGH